LIDWKVRILDSQFVRILIVIWILSTKRMVPKAEESAEVAIELMPTARVMYPM
jgi:hypothetical protein